MTDIYPGMYDSRATAYESKLRHIINDIITPDMTDLEKALAIHDYLVVNTNYILDSTGGSYDLIMKGVAICSTYTNAANDLFNLAVTLKDAGKAVGVYDFLFAEAAISQHFPGT